MGAGCVRARAHPPHPPPEPEPGETQRQEEEGHLQEAQAQVQEWREDQHASRCVCLFELLVSCFVSNLLLARSLHEKACFMGHYWVSRKKQQNQQSKKLQESREEEVRESFVVQLL